MALTYTQELEAFCMTCPPANQVTETLQEAGFCLVFEMAAVSSPAYMEACHLPAQYHYSDSYGTEVLYLAGRDADTDGLRFPPHASRFWIYGGADQAAFQRASQVLAARWSLIWQSVPRSEHQDAA